MEIDVESEDCFSKNQQRETTETESCEWKPILTFIFIWFKSL